MRSKNEAYNEGYKAGYEMGLIRYFLTQMWLKEVFTERYAFFPKNGLIISEESAKAIFNKTLESFKKKC